MASDPEHLIRERAHAIWLAEGSPSGRDQHHWAQAAREIAEEANGKKAKPVRKPRTTSSASATEGSAAPQRVTTPEPKKARSAKPKPVDASAGIKKTVKRAKS